jgi:hypothetical protein
MDLTRGRHSNPPETTTQTEEIMSMPGKKSIPVIALVLAACSVDEPAARIIGTSASLNNGQGVVVKVQGAGVVDFNPAGDFGDGMFQFVATRRADGTVTGHFYQSRERAAGLVEFYGVVTCVTIDPNFPGRARIGGIVTVNNSTDPAFLTADHQVGDDVWFRVEDNGDGSGATEKSTTYGFKPTLVNTSAEYCALAFTGTDAAGNQLWNPASIFPLAQGSINVTQ